MEVIQRLYTQIYNACDGDEDYIGTWGTYIVLLIVFWGFNIPLTFVDLTGKPAWVKKFKIQHGKNEPVDMKMFRRLIETVVFNNIILNMALLYPAYWLQKWRGMSFKPDGVSTLPWFLVEVIAYTMVNEVVFYYTHRLIHHPKLYKDIHKLHHQWTAPIGLVSIYATPAEYLLGNSSSVILGPVLMGSHITSAWIWYAIAFFSTTMHHSGYHLPFMPSPQFHDYHHLRFNWNFGTLGLLDAFHGTDSQFKKEIQSTRHCFHHWFKPIDRVFPETEKQGKS